MSSPLINESNNKWAGHGVLAKIFVGYARSYNHPVKLRIIFAIAQLFFSRGVPMRHITGASIFAMPTDFIGWSIIKTGSYEPRTIALMHSLISNGGTFVDVGANFGLLSSVAVTIEGVSVISIEAHSGNFERLRQTRRASVHSENWMLFNCAISNNRDFVEIEEYRVGNSGMHRVAASNSKTSSNSFRVACRTLSELIDAEDLAEIKVLKIDVEGYEFQVLQGLSFDKSPRPKNIILEFTDYGSRFGYSRKDVYDHLIAAGYELRDISGARKELSDSFMEDNALFIDMK